MQCKFLSLILSTIALLTSFTSLYSQPRIGFDLENLILSNTGDRDLIWEISLEVTDEPERWVADQEDVIARFEGVNQARLYFSPIGCDRFDNTVYFSHYRDNAIYAYSHNGFYNRFHRIRSIETPQPMDGGFFSGCIYVCSPENSSHIKRFDIDGNALEDIELGYPVFGLAFSQTEELMFAREQDGEFPIHVIQMDGINPDEEIGRIEGWAQFCGNIAAYNLEWIDEHNSGHLWINVPHSGLTQIAVDTQNWEPTETVQSFNVATSQPWDGVAHDGFNFWIGGYDNEDIRVYDDGIREQYWLSIEPKEGILEPDEQVQFNVGFDEVGLIGGVYSVDIHINSNDPMEPDFVFPITLEIPGVPRVAVEWNADYGFPEVMDFNRRYQDVFVEGHYDFPFEVLNIGTDDIVIFDCRTDNECFSVDFPEEVIIDPGHSLAMEINFAPDQSDMFETILSLQTNDPNQENIEIPVRAEAFNPPVIAVDPTAIYEELGWGETVEYMVDISNEGDHLLRWQAELEELNPDRDSTIITFDPASGEIEPGASMNITIRIDLVQSNFMDEFNIWIQSNDPVHPAVAISIRVRSTSVESSDPLPLSTGLLSVWPNPFNSSATIQFCIEKPGQATLGIYGINGKLIETLDDNPSDAGYHTITWNAEGIPTGTYFVLLSEGGRIIQGKRLIFMK